MARNRKRAKDRRTRQPEAASVRAGRADPDGAQPDDSGVARSGEAGRPAGGTPAPMEHATPDVELAQAQLAAGRPPADEDLERRDETKLDSADVESFDEEEPVDADDGSLALQAPDRAGRGRAAPERSLSRREPLGRRLIGFLQGSWRELQRVQWPDRRQVMQATSVVIGFVIVAGAFLGVADFLAGKLVSFILK